MEPATICAMDNKAYGAAKHWLQYVKDCDGRQYRAAAARHWWLHSSLVAALILPRLHYYNKRGAITTSVFLVGRLILVVVFI